MKKMNKKEYIIKTLDEILEEIKWARSTNDEMHTKATLNIIEEKIKKIKKILK